MSLVLGQMLNPSGSNESPATVLEAAGDSSARWMAMSVLFFAAAAAVGLVLGLPCILSLFTGKGRVLGMIGVGIFSVGAISLAGFSAVMLMFRALAVNEAVDLTIVDDVLADGGLSVMLNVWAFSFLGGVAVIALALFRSKRTPAWVPGLLTVFLVIQFVPLSDGRAVSAIGLLAFAAGLTGIATRATSLASPGPTIGSAPVSPA
ncbi:MAG TPA: hypothetical protein VFD59_20690 [Nocardioidaceae bacterium]|nr:hypothetical protein [Nocardioidaceae bacterium]